MLLIPCMCIYLDSLKNNYVNYKSDIKRINSRKYK